MSYNGWSNRQTWLLVVHDFYCGAFEENQFDSVDDLAKAMESMFDDWADENRPRNPLASDLFQESGIDFYQIAGHFTEFVKPEPDEQEDEDDGA